MKLTELLNRDISLTGRPHSTWQISKNELESFILLQDHGLQTRKVIEMSFKESSRFIAELEEGKTMQAVLMDHLPKQKLLHILAKHMRFSKAVKAASRIDQAQKLFFDELIKKSAYPVFLFVFACALTIFFSGQILPVMARYAPGALSIFMITLMKNVYVLILILLALVCSAAAALFYLKEVPGWFSITACKFPLVKKICTYHFACLYSILWQNCPSTSKTAQILDECRFLKSIRLILGPLNAGLESGKDLYQVLQSIPLVDPDFLVFFKSAMNTAALCDLLDLYCQKTMLSLEQTIKKTGTAVSILAYGSAGLLVLTVYQIMLMPLNMLNTF